MLGYASSPRALLFSGNGEINSATEVCQATRMLLRAVIWSRDSRIFSSGTEVIAQTLGCGFCAFIDLHSYRILVFGTGFRVNRAIQGAINLIIVPWLPLPWMVQSQKQLVVSKDVKTRWWFLCLAPCFGLRRYFCYPLALA